MGANSKIQWTDHTFNPWRGCTKVSEGCAHCYAETLSKRNPKLLGVWGKGQPRVLASESMWKEPLKWNAAADQDIEEAIHDFGADNYMPPTRPRVFCASLADVWDEEVPPCWRLRLFRLIFETPNLDWLLLSKRPQNFIPMLAQCMNAAWGVPQVESPFAVWLEEWLTGKAPHNVWMGTTVEYQALADERVPVLLKIPAAVRFLSCEPLLEPVDLTRFLWDKGMDRYWPKKKEERIDWVIAGGESGPGARPMHPDWARALREQCVSAGVPFLFKQWGEWLPNASLEVPVYKGECVNLEGCHAYRVGKVAAGRLLDGREWNEFPSVGGAL